MSNAIPSATKPLTLDDISASIDLGSGNLYLLYAKLQLVLADANKKKARTYMDEVLATQEEVKQVNAYVTQLQAKKADKNFEFSTEIKEFMDKNQLQTSGSVKTTKPDPTRTIKLTDVDISGSGLSSVNTSQKSAMVTKYGADAIEYFQKNPKANSYTVEKATVMEKTTVTKKTGKRNKVETVEVNKPKSCNVVFKRDAETNYKSHTSLTCNKEQFEANIASLKNYQEQLGSTTQIKMVFINDFLSQANSYTQGANTSVDKSNQALHSIITGR
jgi:hypothetical protein